MRSLYLYGSECAVVEDGRLVEYVRQDGERRTGDIYLGRVGRIVPGLKAAFVDIGTGKDGFLPLTENNASFEGENLRSGDRVIVQIRREAHGEKGAFLSRDINFPGMLVMVMPLNRHIGVSSRISAEEERERLHAMGEKAAAGRCGLVVRNAALEMTEEALQRETETLLRRWDGIRKKAAEEKAPALLYTEDNPWQSLLNDYLPRGIDNVIEGQPFPDDLIRQRREALNRKVNLPHGGNIVIDRCEAMTVIDVNTASDAGWGKTMLRTNLEACREIALQLRLRNLSGIVIIDMIDLPSEADRDQVLRALQEALSADRYKTVVHGYTSLGLIEMTRKRFGKPLDEMLAEETV